MNSTCTVRIEGPLPYTVIMGRGSIEQTTEAVTFASQVAAIHQESVQELSFDVIKALVDKGADAFSIQVPDAEEGKTLVVAETVWDTSGERGLGRRDTVIAASGGAVTGLGGFVAAA